MTDNQMFEVLNKRIMALEEKECAWRRMMNREYQSMGFETLEDALLDTGFLADIIFRTWCGIVDRLEELETLRDLHNRKQREGIL